MNLIQKSALARVCRKTVSQISDKEVPIGLTKGVTPLYDVPYLKDGNSAHTLDIYCPTTYEEQIPVIVYIHGGGFEKGNKELNRHLCMKLSNYGFLVFSLGYRLCPETTICGQLQDVAAALHYVDKIAPKFRGIPGMVHMAGDCAGAFLAIYSAAIQRNPVLAQAAEVRPCYLEIRSLVLISGMFYIQKQPAYLQRRLLGVNYKQHPFYAYLDPTRPILGLSIPDCMLITSKKDKFHLQSCTLVQALNKWDTPVILKDCGADPSLTHAFCVSDPERPESRMVIHDIITFFRETESKS